MFDARGLGPTVDGAQEAALEQGGRLQRHRAAAPPPGVRGRVAMSPLSLAVEASPEAARAPLTGSGRWCPGCGGPLAGRRRACSGRCRAALSQARRAAAQQARDRELCAALELVVGLAQDALGRLREDA
jgi:hypothetical protein